MQQPARGPAAQAQQLDPAAGRSGKSPPLPAARHTTDGLAQCHHTNDQGQTRGELAGAPGPTAAAATTPAHLIPKHRRPHRKSGGIQPSRLPSQQSRIPALDLQRVLLKHLGQQVETTSGLVARRAASAARRPAQAPSSDSSAAQALRLCSWLRPALSSVTSCTRSSACGAKKFCHASSFATSSSG